MPVTGLVTLAVDGQSVTVAAGSTVIAAIAVHAAAEAAAAARTANAAAPVAAAARIGAHASPATAGATAGAAVTRRSVGGMPRGPLCGIGVCQECRVEIDGRAHQLACQTPCAPDMRVRTCLGENPA